MKPLLVFILFFGVYSCRDYPESRIFNMRTQETFFNMRLDKKENKDKKKKYERLQNLVL